MMDLTPLEVRKKKGDFRRQIRGYDPESVDDFLDLVADRLEELVRENAALTESSSGLEQRVSDYRERERALTEALVSAQQLREEMRAKAVQEADAARSQAERDAHEHRSLAAQEAEQARREARELLERARAEAANELESARQSATAEMERIRGELERIRDRESEIIRTLQIRRAELLESYRGLLEGEIAELETLRSTALGPADLPAAGPVVAAPTDALVAAAAPAPPMEPAEGVERGAPESELPPLSADLAALIEAAESDVDLAWASSEAADTAEAAQVGGDALQSSADDSPEWATAPLAEAEATIETLEAGATAELVLEDIDSSECVPSIADGDELVLDDPAAETIVANADDFVPPAARARDEVMGAQDDSAWLSGLVENGAERTKEAAPAPARAEWENGAGDSDEDFIDSLIAEAGVAPVMGGRLPSGPPPAFLANLDDDAEAVADPPEVELLEADEAGEAVTAAAASFEAGEETVEAAPGAEVTTAAADAAPPSDPLDILDDDEGFDALFDDGDDEPAEFDFDAALANATGFSGYSSESRNDADSAFDLGVELDDPTSPLELGRGSTGSFAGEDLRKPPLSGAFTPTRRSELTLRPLSPEEEAPDLPVESRPRGETDDDMFSTMFRGR